MPAPSSSDAYRTHAGELAFYVEIALTVRNIATAVTTTNRIDFRLVQRGGFFLLT